MLGFLFPDRSNAEPYRFSPNPSVTADTRIIGVKALISLIEAGESLGYAREVALADLDEARRALDQPRSRISWRSLVRTVENLERAGMSIAELERAGAHIARSPHLLVRPVAAFFLRAEHALYVGLRWAGPATFPVMSAELDYRGREMRMTLELSDEMPGCAGYFHVCKGAIAAVPTAVGQPPAVVAARISSRVGEFDIRCAPFDRGAVRLGRIARALQSVPRMVETLVEQQSAILSSLDAARDSESQLLRVLSALPDAAVIVRDDVIVCANPTLARALGYERASELSGACWSKLVEPRARQLASAQPGVTECRVLHRDGREVDLELSPRQRIEYEGADAELLLARDVTERNRLVGQLATADRMASLATVAAGIAHEINNPLAMVIGNLELAQRDDRDTREYLRAASEGAARVREIVRELGVFARPDHDTVVAVDLGEVVESTVALARAQIAPRATLRLELERVPVVSGSRGKLGQVLLNLLINALEALPPDRSADENRITVRLSRGDTGARLEVEDNGMGIARAAQPHVFAPYFSARASGGGTGLGLAVAHDIVTKSRGAIGFSSRPGAGTTFRVELPYCSGDPSPVAPPAAASTSRRARILVVDDEPALLRTLAAALEWHEVVTAVSGRDAIDKIEKCEPLDLILCDLMMPDGSGPELHAHLSKHRPELARRTIFMSGGTYHDAAREFLASVGNRRLDKPFTLHELSRVVDAALDEA